VRWQCAHGWSAVVGRRASMEHHLAKLALKARRARARPEQLTQLTQLTHLTR